MGIRQREVPHKFVSVRQSVGIYSNLKSLLLFKLWHYHVRVCNLLNGLRWEAAHIHTTFRGLTPINDSGHMLLSAQEPPGTGSSAGQFLTLSYHPFIKIDSQVAVRWVI